MIIVGWFEIFFTRFVDSLVIIGSSITSVLNTCAFKLGGYNVSFAVLFLVLLVLGIVVYVFCRGT